MKDRQQIKNILSNLNKGDYAKAEEILSTVLESRVKDRIRDCDAG